MKFMKYCALIILTCICCSQAFASKINQKIIMSYWSNGKRYMPYPIPGSLNARKEPQKNKDLSGKLSAINVLAYAFLQVDDNGYADFSRPMVDLSQDDLTHFCKSHKVNCPKMAPNVLLGNFDAFSKLNNRNKDLKKIISIGGAGSEKSFLNAINHPNNFIKSVISIIKYYRLNGIDLDFELYSLFTEKQAHDYTQLIKNLRLSLGQQYFISIETPPDNETLKSIGRNNWTIIANNAYVSIMGYEFHSYLYTPYYTANNSNLYSDPNEPNVKGFYHISDDQSVKYLTYLGVPANKIILGIPAYFHAYGEVGVKNHGLYQPFNPHQTPLFDYGKGKGSYILMQKLLKNGFVSHEILMNGKISAVYAYNAQDDQWISYENEKSVAAKVKYVIKNNLAGLMMWNIKQDLPANNTRSLLMSIHSVTSGRLTY